MFGGPSTRFEVQGHEILLPILSNDNIDDLLTISENDDDFAKIKKWLVK